MQLVSRDRLKPGMQVAEDIVDAQGRLILPRGTNLEKKHFKALAMWGISSVSVEGDTGEEEDEGAEKLSPEEMETARGKMRELFTLNLEMQNHALVSFLMEECAQTIALSTRKGKRKQGLKLLLVSDDDEHVEIPPPESASALLDRVQSVGTLPGVYMRLMEVIAHPHSSAADIGHVISGDPGLTVRLLKLVNSSFYGLPSRVDTVSQAVTIVGTAQLSDLALATSVIQMFHQVLGKMIDMEAFWRHCISTGVLARRLALERCEPNVERLFVAGLLHDVGRLIMFKECPSLLGRAINEAKRKKQPLFVVEGEILGFTHALVGAALLKRWNLPEVLSRATRGHHKPQSGSNFCAESAMVHVADFIANARLMGTTGTPVIPALSVEAWNLLGISTGAIPRLMENIDCQIEDVMNSVLVRD